ncbi:acyltransferase family protein [Rheinheimera maricola]|uniref:Heparan-alpha-glucosaminide N-acetyltransferase domain-containing protein n=1 Tax=Rheinheimera maricola TaxID=2793282 RepID=A0ABS7X7F6_9GAMM|nr:heparan-alpha-glucosaminide N-acetyltransferase domain-containing protein [Rheinheimera maricola]MBZ9611478.1 heparan-alpha-glucosaminide N-acetyltransferase domain-containing protein [Rheinheimera maricola]
MTGGRFYALDALRGLAIALMILVNTPGSWQHVYSPLLHAPWHGFTFADIVFPAFLFVVGAAMFYSLRHTSLTGATLSRIAKRAALLFVIGLLLNWFPFTTSWAELRIFGVLQRIALCYAVAAILVLLVKARYLPWLGVAILLVYWALLLGFGAAEPYSLDSNAVVKLDRYLLGSAHLYQGFGQAFDPEGLLSSLPAVVSVLAGYYVAGQLALRSAPAGALWLVNAAALLLTLAWTASVYWPVNKALWSGSYVLLSVGILLLILAMLVWLCDVKQQRPLLQPLIVYGSNPLFIYMLAWLCAVSAALIPLGGTNLYQYSFALLAQLLAPKAASLLFAVLHVVLFWWVSLLLYRRNIIIKL